MSAQIGAYSGYDFGADQAVMDQFIASSKRVWQGQVDDTVIGIWGIIQKTIASDPYLWFYATPELDRYKMTFARHSREVIAEILDHHSRIIGHCEACQFHSQRWLRWLGATFCEAEGGLVMFEIRRFK